MIKTNEYNFRVRLDGGREKLILDRLKQLGVINQNSDFLRKKRREEAQRSLPLHEFVAFYPDEARTVIAARNPHMSPAELSDAIANYQRVAQQKELIAKSKRGRLCNTFKAPEHFYFTLNNGITGNVPV